jgi:predicted dithiol-disulfide oxidoreductase (DUF899 family)
MFGPDWEDGCPSCTAGADEKAPGLFAHLHARATSLVHVARAPLAKIERYKAKRGWSFPFYSSFGSDFNYDFQVTVDEAHPEYNYQPGYYASILELESKGKDAPPREREGLSVFLRDAEHIHHAYSTYARGVDPFLNTYNLLDHTPLGRHEDGTPMAWLRHHDRY